MTPVSSMLATACGMAVTGAAAAYAIMTAAATLWWRHGRSRTRDRYGSPAPAAVTVLKPLCGAEPRLYDCLRSFCEQAYPCYQVVFGVRDPEDPAVAIVRRLQREFPDRDLELVIDATEHGSSLKVSNLINMLRAARHDLLVIADSDVRVPRDHLRRVAAPLGDPGVGVVTCSYRGVPRGGPWSLLLAAFVNDWFMPSVYVAAALGSRAFDSGATIALRRGVLEAIGGFEAIADQLADDYRLGELTRAKGLATILSDVIVETDLHEANARDLIRHELRWLRTIRAVRPGGYASLFVTFSLPAAVLGAFIAAWSEAGIALVGITALARLLLHFEVRRRGTAALELWVVPVGDTLAFALWCWGFVSRRVHWRQTRYRVARDGSVQPIA